MSGAAAQRERAIEGHYAPTIASLYEDAEVAGANPHFHYILPGEALVARPSTPTGKGYQAFSDTYTRAIHRILTGEVAARAGLEAAQVELSKLAPRREVRRAN
jgi:trehalose/maltose transport system substrate-binding protein